MKQKKIKEYKGLIGKTIVKIHNDNDMVRLYFNDNTYADLCGNRDFIYIDESNHENKLMSLQIYE